MKIKYLLIGVVGLILILSLIFFILFSIQREEYREAVNNIENKALELIRQRNYNAGLKICDEFSLKYYTTYVCHSVALGIKLSNKEIITKEFCDSFPLKFESNLPFVLRLFEKLNKAELFEKEALQQKESCESYIT